MIRLAVQRSTRWLLEQAHHATRCTAARPLSTTATVHLNIPLNTSGSEVAVLPDKPAEPAPELCCMSGCAQCVWTLYADDMEAYERGLRNLREQLKQQQQPEPKTLTRLIEELEIEPTAHGPDASMRAFMEMERKMKSK